MLLIPVSEIAQIGKLAYLKFGVRLVNVGTKSGEAMFWSGIEGGWKTAAKLAGDCNLKTLELTSGGSWLLKQDLSALSLSQQSSLWGTLSSRYASSASGEIFLMHARASIFQNMVAPGKLFDIKNESFSKQNIDILFKLKSLPIE